MIEHHGPTSEDRRAADALERKRARQREWVRRKRATNPAYAAAECERHHQYLQTAAGYLATVRHELKQKRAAAEEASLRLEDEMDALRLEIAASYGDAVPAALAGLIELAAV